ncbi:MAG: hypothetical protein HQK89_17040 [Nitrospirae bacterium]|nr:hypothetical protein [Nitrospirota bacterium]
MGEPWPQSYATAENAIKTTSETCNYINRLELYKIFEASNIREEDFAIVSSVMGDMGIITHFPDCVDLRDFIVLKPHWLTKAISHVMEDKELAENQGECTLKCLRDKWDENPEYRDLSHIFHSAMKQFELCYELDSHDHLNLVPLRFGDKKPEIPWSYIPGADQRTIQYRFDATPPAGIMSRFIVKTHHMIVKPPSMPKGIYWFNGVFLTTGEGLMRSEALCEFVKIQEAQIFNITVRAAFPQNMIEQLHALANAVFSFFEGLKPSRYYGCFRQDGGQCPGFHWEENIMYNLNEKISEILCVFGRHKINLLKLIYGNTSFAASASVKEDLRQVFLEEMPKLSIDISNISKDVNSVITRVNALSKDILDARHDISELPANVNQKFQQAFRDYLNLFDDMLDARDFTPVPSIIAIVPSEEGNILMRDLFKKTMTLSLYCEQEKGVHKTNYNLEFKITREWWEKTAPVAGVLFDGNSSPAKSAMPKTTPPFGHPSLKRRGARRAGWFVSLSCPPIDNLTYYW